MLSALFAGELKRIAVRKVSRESAVEMLNRAGESSRHFELQAFSCADLNRSRFSYQTSIDQALPVRIWVHEGDASKREGFCERRKLRRFLDKVLVTDPLQRKLGFLQRSRFTVCGESLMSEPADAHFASLFSFSLFFFYLVLKYCSHSKCSFRPQVYVPPSLDQRFVATCVQEGDGLRCNATVRLYSRRYLGSANDGALSARSRGTRSDERDAEESRPLQDARIKTDVRRGEKSCRQLIFLHFFDQGPSLCQVTLGVRA